MTERLKSGVALLLISTLGWALCGLSIAAGRAITSMENTLVIHAAGVPVIFFVLSTLYFSRFKTADPFKTALFVVGFTITMDLLVVAPFFEKSFAMFGSVLGTWIPFALIFITVLLAGKHRRGKTVMRHPTA